METNSPRHPSTVPDTAEEIARDVAAVGKLEAVPTLLEVLCETTGMRFAAVARVTENTWTACAVKDDINFGLKPGGQLDLESTLCIESKRSNQAIVIEHASADERYCNHHTPKRYRIESYVSVPIVLANGRYFGNLCAIDPAPAKVAGPKIVGMFTRFAALIALQLDSDASRQQDQSALRDAHASSELRDQFIAILGHDLRNPLQAVYSAGVLLEKKVSDPTLKDVAARIRINVKRMTSLINDVLDFARSRLGDGMGVRIAEVEDLGAGLNAVVQEFKDGQPDRQILTNISVAGKVRCDLGRVQQVASNLIGNALKHGAAQGPVKVSARAEESDFILDVWNAGEPIPPESLDRICEPFWRQSSTGNREGLGLGLYICSQIVRAHGGTLSVSSTPESGTHFTARLPLDSEQLHHEAGNNRSH
ncbi:MAG TPA: GAF domain-containing sensor histidine kinase [Steroidobacteraceae bacterium]|nr:GAF domain-containing sensor histidine kinase [Steroidobacteraceae bacterium]